MTGTHKAYRTKSPGKIEVVHEAELSKNFGLANINWSIFGVPWPFLCWEKYDERAFVRVTENSLDTNYPLMCIPCSVTDMISVKMWDKHPAGYEQATACTPFHFCCCVEMCGQVAATSVHPACNNTCGTLLGLRRFVPGLKDANAFCKAANAARDEFKLKPDQAPGAQKM
jgi:hypothetical protein